MKLSTKAIEHDLCAALEHPLLHLNPTRHACKCGYRTVVGLIESGNCPQCNEGRMEDLLADLDVLIDFEHRIRSHPELVAKIERFIEPKDLEKTIKAVAAAVREHLGLEKVKT
jgi:hypothetical protein